MSVSLLEGYLEANAIILQLKAIKGLKPQFLKSSLFSAILTVLTFRFSTELLRVIRRLNLKEQWTDLSLHYLTLGTLRSALSQNPRAQNHFRSIGGLEVLLDGLGVPSNKYSVSKSTFVSGNQR